MKVLKLSSATPGAGERYVMVERIVNFAKHDNGFTKCTRLRLDTGDEIDVLESAESIARMINEIPNL